MIHEFDNMFDASTNASKKDYTAMKVSKLGSLAELTQATMNGSYSDGGMTGMMIQMSMM